MDYKKITTNIYKIARKNGYKPGILKDKDLSVDTGGKSKRKHKKTKRLPPRDKKIDSYNAMPSKVLDEIGKDTLLDPDTSKIRRKHKIKKRKNG